MLEGTPVNTFSSDCLEERVDIFLHHKINMGSDGSQRPPDCSLEQSRIGKEASFRSKAFPTNERASNQPTFQLTSQRQKQDTQDWIPTRPKNTHSRVKLAIWGRSPDSPPPWKSEIWVGAPMEKKLSNFPPFPSLYCFSFVEHEIVNILEFGSCWHHKLVITRTKTKADHQLSPTSTSFQSDPPLLSKGRSQWVKA